MIFYLMEANSLAITNMLESYLTMQTLEEIPARWRGGVAADSRGSRHVIISRTTFLGCMLHIAAYQRLARCSAQWETVDEVLTSFLKSCRDDSKVAGQ